MDEMDINEPMEANMDEENDGQNSDSTRGSNEQVTTCGTPVEDLWLDFKCVFCDQDLKSIVEPKLLQCLHTACSSCLTTLSNESSNGTTSSTSVLMFNEGKSKRGAKNGRGKNKRGGRSFIFSNRKGGSDFPKQLSCAACSQEIVPSDVVDHLFLTEYVQNLESMPEESSYPCSCEEGQEGVGFCQECQEWLCITCVTAHHRVRLTKDHTVRSKEDMDGENAAGKNQKYMFCQTHTHEQLKLYCETCDKLTCRDCQLNNHKEHKYQFLTKACEEEKGHINELLSRIVEKQHLMENASDNLNKRHEEILDRELGINQEIKTFAIRFITEINKRSKAILDDLQKVCNEKKNQLNVKNKELSTVTERLKHCQKFAEAAVSLGSDTALVYSKKPIMNQLRRILKHRCEIPHQNHAINIAFKYETTFLVQYIASLGQILVDQQPIPGSSSTQEMLPMPQLPSTAINRTTPAVLRPNAPQQPMQNHAMQQMQRTPQQAMRHRMPMVQHQQATYGQPQVTSSTDMTRPQIRAATNTRMPNAQQQIQQQMQRQQQAAQQQRNNVQQSIQARQQQANYSMQNATYQQQQQTQQRQLALQQQQAQQQRLQQIQQQQQAQQQQQQQTQQSAPPALPISLRQNNSISVTTVPSPNPSPNKQRNLNVSVVSSNQSSPQRSAGPQVIVLDDKTKTPTMSNTSRLSHFPNIAATIAAHPGLQIQPTNNKYTSKF